MQIERRTLTFTRPVAVRLRRGAIAAITALACAALASACGSSKGSSETAAKTPVDTARVALDIEHSLLAKRQVHAKVVCPARVAAVPGATFECIATSRATKPPFTVTKTPFLATIQNARGYVTYVGK